jgi:hypothetical protein
MARKKGSPIDEVARGLAPERDKRFKDPLMGIREQEKRDRKKRTDWLRKNAF